MIVPYQVSREIRKIDASLAIGPGIFIILKYAKDRPEPLAPSSPFILMRYEQNPVKSFNGKFDLIL